MMRMAHIRPPSRPARFAEGGYNLVVLMVLVTVMNIVLAAALPTWTHVLKRDKEAELIFRGMQYAEAIRVFQQRHGRLPLTLKELVEVEPRSIRQLYPDPMTEHGNWGLLIQAARPAGRGRGQNQRGAAQPANASTQGSEGENVSNQTGSASGAERARGVGAGSESGRSRPGRRSGGNMVAVPPSTEEEGFGRPTQRTTGPIVGVYSASDEPALRTFLGQSAYDQWQFHLGLIPTPVMLGGENPAPRVHSGWVGKPFRSDLQPQRGGAPGNAGQDATGRRRQGQAPSARPSLRPKNRSRSR